MGPTDVHGHHATALRTAATSPGATIDGRLRSAVLERAAGGSTPLPEPYDALARQIRDAAYRVTDGQVAAVREITGSDKGAFEVIMCACIGAGLARWDAAVRAIEEAGDAAP